MAALFLLMGSAAGACRHRVIRLEAGDADCTWAIGAGPQAPEVLLLWEPWPTGRDFFDGVVVVLTDRSRQHCVLIRARNFRGFAIAATLGLHPELSDSESDSDIVLLG